MRLTATCAARVLRPGGALIVYGSPERLALSRLLLFAVDHAGLRLVQQLTWCDTQGGGSRVSQSVVGRRCRIGQGATVRGPYLWADVVIEDGAIVEDSILCDGVVVNAPKCPDCSSQVMEVVEHVLHTVTSVGLPRAWPDENMGAYAAVPGGAASSRCGSAATLLELALGGELVLLLAHHVRKHPR